MNETLLSIKQVAERVGVNRATIYRYIEAGEFPAPVRVGPRLSRWPSSAIDAFIARQIAADRPPPKGPKRPPGRRRAPTRPRTPKGRA